MIIVIQCAASKRETAGFLQKREGKSVLFVADPERAPNDENYIFARPDDIADTGNSWRDDLVQYNATLRDNNPLGLLPAWELYSNDTYGMLEDKYGSHNLFILSAGWGLISADFLTPYYDITFSSQADAYKRRRKKDHYNDFCMLPSDADDQIVFFVSKEYVPLACKLTEDVIGPRYLFYNSKTAPSVQECNLLRYETRTRTNWQYECAKAFMSGEIGI